jgi:hypothetical protein
MGSVVKIVAYQMFFHKQMSNALRASGHEFVFLSSERRSDESGIIDTFYTTSNEARLDEKTINDVILRCRYLSGINNKRARENVRKMWFSVENFLTSHNPDLVVMQAVDNYVADLVCRISAMLRIPCFQPRRSPLGGMVRITNALDHPKMREVDDEEVLSVIANFRSDFKASYQKTKKRTKAQILAKLGREIVKKVLFEYWKKRYADPLSFHYNAIFPNENAITITSLAQLSANSFYDQSSEDILEKKKYYKDVVFWPLAMCPESAICYMNNDCRLSDYKDIINRVTSTLPEGVLLIIKEHPSAVGFRPISHYDGIVRNENVLFASMDISTGRLIEISNKILINTSSTTGMEAAVLGKPVLSLGSCHYAMKGIVHNIANVDQFENWYENFPRTEISEGMIKGFTRNYLENTIHNATWGPHGGDQPDFELKIRSTLEACVSLAESGYVPLYFSITET